MEGNHIAVQKLPNNASVFGVFDSYGKNEFVFFVKKHFISQLLKNECFNNQEDLYQTFLEIDVMLQTKEAQKVIQQLMESYYRNKRLILQLMYAQLQKQKIYVQIHEIVDQFQEKLMQYFLKQKKSIALQIDHKPVLPEKNKRNIYTGRFYFIFQSITIKNIVTQIYLEHLKKHRNLCLRKQVITAAPDIKKWIQQNMLSFQLYGMMELGKYSLMNSKVYIGNIKYILIS